MQMPIKLIFLFCVAQTMIFGEEWNTVYLASYPRSGNHWVRFLVEEATHIATSSTYRDRDYRHLPNIQPWGGYCTDHGYEGHCRYPMNVDPVLIKTHYPYFPRKIDPFPKCAICLIRHPIDAFWSFYVYRGGKEMQIDTQTVIELVQTWRKFYTFWLNQPDVLFIRYEDLQSDVAYYLSLILQTAGYSFDETDIRRAVAKYPSQGDTLKHIKHYDEESIQIIETELGDLLKGFNYDL